MIKGFNNSELSIAVEAFVRHKLDEKKATLRDWEARYGVEGFGGQASRRHPDRLPVRDSLQGMEEVARSAWAGYRKWPVSSQSQGPTLSAPQVGHQQTNR
jgi:hypothetical protein